MAFLFRDKRPEIDRMLNMMAEREKPDFLLSSLQLFGPIAAKLLDIDKAIFVVIEPKPKPSSARKMMTGADRKTVVSGTSVTVSVTLGGLSGHQKKNKNT